MSTQPIPADLVQFEPGSAKAVAQLSTTFTVAPDGLGLTWTGVILTPLDELAIYYLTTYQGFYLLSNPSG